MTLQKFIEELSKLPKEGIEVRAEWSNGCEEKNCVDFDFGKDSGFINRMGDVIISLANVGQTLGYYNQPSKPDPMTKSISFIHKP